MDRSIAATITLLRLNTFAKLRCFPGIAAPLTSEIEVLILVGLNIIV